MKKLVAKKKKRKTWKNCSRNANSSSAEKYLERCLPLPFGKRSVADSHQNPFHNEDIFISAAPVGEVSRGIRACVPVRLMMHPTKRLHIIWSIDLNWMIWSSIGKWTRVVSAWSGVSSDISEYTFNHNGYLIRSMHENYYQLINICQVILPLRSSLCDQ